MKPLLVITAMMLDALERNAKQPIAKSVATVSSESNQVDVHTVLDVRMFTGQERNWTDWLLCIR